MASTEAAGAAPPGATSFLATVWATGFGSGYSPIAPGTAGSVVGVVLFWAGARGPLLLQVAVLAAIFFTAVVASTRVARQTGLKDPGIVVVDEIVGIWITLFALPFTLPVVVAGFLLFRLLDVVKPPPARRLEGLPGGWGIVLDDAMVAIYANLILRAALLVWPVS